jgi:hypothetical protein
MIGSAGKMLVGDLPRIAVGRSFLADPMEAVGGDFGETPPRFQAARILATVPENVNEVVLGYCRQRIDQMLKRIDFSADKSVSDLTTSYATQTGALDVAAIAAGIEKMITDAIADDNLPALLAIYDRKKQLLALAARLRAGSVNEFTALVTHAIQSKEDDKLRMAIETVLPTPSAA